MPNYLDENGYNDSNRAFLQAFMSRSTMTFDEARPVLAAIFSVHEGRPILPEDVTQADFSSYIASANTAISPFDLEIRGIVHQVPKENSNGNSGRVYALVNTTSDPLTQLATTYTADEISFVKRVLDAIFETFNTSRCEAMVITGVQAMQLAKAGSGDASRRESNGTASQSQGATAQSLSMTQAELVMKRLVEEGWFEMSEKGFYSLSPRGLIELRGWLVETYNDDEENDYRANRIKFCAACKDVITVGQRCSNRNCLGRLHDLCVRNFFRMQKAEKCPICKAPWPGDKFVGERAIERPTQGGRRGRNTGDGQAAHPDRGSESDHSGTVG